MNNDHLSELCTCTGGLTSLDDDYSQPTYCERCTTGLRLALDALGKGLMDMTESQQALVDRAARLTDPFFIACSKAAEQQLVDSVAEYDRLENLYQSLGGYSAMAAAVG